MVNPENSWESKDDTIIFKNNFLKSLIFLQPELKYMVNPENRCESSIFGIIFIKNFLRNTASVTTLVLRGKFRSKTA